MLAKLSKKWTEPKISASGKEWSVWFRFYDDVKGKWVLVRRKGGANSSKLSKRERLGQLNILRQAIAYRLEKLDWNPITNTCISEEELSIDQQISDLAKMSIAQAIDFAMEKKKAGWASKTIRCYESVTKYILEAAKELKLTDKLIVEFKKVHFKVILERTKKNRNFSPKGYNKYRRYLSGLINELVEWDIIENNPIANIKTMAVAKTFAHRPPTEEERAAIMQHLRINYPTFYRFCFTMYATSIRGKEILGLQVKDFFKKEQLFRILPINEKSKVKFEREAVIPNSLMEELSELNLETLNPDWYIFSKGFLPGPKRMHANMPTAWWYRIVKETLKINVDLYSLKKLGGDDMIRQGISLYGVKDQMGHTSLDTTEIYVREHKRIHKEMIRERMPVL